MKEGLLRPSMAVWPTLDNPREREILDHLRLAVRVDKPYNDEKDEECCPQYLLDVSCEVFKHHCSLKACAVRGFLIGSAFPSLFIFSLSHSSQSFMAFLRLSWIE